MLISMLYTGSLFNYSINKLIEIQWLKITNILKQIRRS